jgi:hypothetical protein
MIDYLNGLLFMFKDSPVDFILFVIAVLLATLGVTLLVIVPFM